eukprot:CAMPEP_0197586896 /NCGR_PEP_ID=MMETSP1326-20131121/8713_1 /TAXON_ID=1155430 /ORGANISM="Genus nov. species nov., Strain RCC2288" /LENGTH=586 /DNA_ID=CAMNT_0043151563 /DNA_START=175 /DNA_END=1931 /DNA_ORIENTATION=+
MGKKSASKDRNYVTATEWKTEGGGFKDRAAEGIPFRRLPYYCCAISFLPFDDPVMTDDGTVMDLMHAVPYVQKHHKHPVSGAPLELKDLTKLHFAKNADGEYECPVLNKTFTDSTHIVAVRTSGNVYCFQAIDELCVKPKSWRDLITDEKFTRKDLITIQDPMNLEGRVLDKFEHVKKGHDRLPGGRGDEADATAAGGADLSSLNARAISADIKRVLDKLGTDDAVAALDRGGGGRKAQSERELAMAKQKAAADAHDAANPKKAGSGEGTKDQTRAPGDKSHLLKGPSPNLHPLDNVRFRPGSHTWNTDGTDAYDARWGEDERAAKEAMNEKFKIHGNHISVKTKVNPMRTTGAGSTSFTSTVMSRNDNSTANTRVEEVIFRNPKKKGYVRLATTHGDINIELHCDVAPRTCENFITLCAAGYYDNVAFHRSIKNFMIQGGDPTGTGSGGQCIWGAKFKDEITHLQHTGRGVLSMANSGPGTNGSQFFILYKSARHLDGKHTVFGNVVGGMDTLAKLERVPTDKNDKPLAGGEAVAILGATVFTNPYKEMAEEEDRLEQEAAAKEQTDAQARTDAMNPGRWWSNPA